MKFTNLSDLPASWTMGFQRDGREMLVVIVKATYALPADGQEANLAVEHVPLVEADQFSGEPGLTAPLFETDYAHRKPLCDVLLVGNAHSPKGRPTTRTQVCMRVGSINKQFSVVGKRVWQKTMAGIVSSGPESFDSLPIGYDHAFGGTDRSLEDKGEISTFARNPVGKGYWRNKHCIDLQPLPHTEEDGRAVVSYDGDYTPVSFSPIGRNWPPRTGFAGTYDQQWIENTAPFWPDNFDERYFQAAPPDQTMPYPQGGEEVVLTNLTPEGRRTFRIPRREMPIVFIPHKGRDANRSANVDTIVIEPDQERFTLTWRTTLPLGRSVFDVREVVVGETSAAWRRSRLYPGKEYYRDLDELIRYGGVT